MSIKEFVRTNSERSIFFFKLYEIIHERNVRSRERLGDEEFAQQMYKAARGFELNLNNPRTFDEKQWWLKIHYRNPLETICTDKLKARDYVAECGYPDILNDLYGNWEKAEDIDFSKLQSPCFLKCNNGSGANIIYRGGQDFDKRYFAYKFNYYLTHNHYRLSREWNYKDIQPRIIAEKVLRDANGNLPLNYRFLCFAGTPKLMFLDLDECSEAGHHNHVNYRNVYDMDFNLVDMRAMRENKDTDAIQRPTSFERMEEIAAALSSPFPFCRVDLYDIDGRIMFGEITFYHRGGICEMNPREWEERIGSWIDLEALKGDPKQRKWLIGI